jgi:hypothetical protein
VARQLLKRETEFEKLFLKKKRCKDVFKCINAKETNWSCVGDKRHGSYRFVQIHAQAPRRSAPLTTLGPTTSPWLAHAPGSPIACLVGPRRLAALGPVVSHLCACLRVPSRVPQSQSVTIGRIDKDHPYCEDPARWRMGRKSGITKYRVEQRIRSGEIND